uniref:Uncharacterized protein n=1 Tax=Rhizophora mucronata TaxID=61149 RepID=A0A2P2PVE1_RHIMU
MNQNGQGSTLKMGYKTKQSNIKHS